MTQRATIKPDQFVRQPCQHDWAVWDEHYRRCRWCNQMESVGISEQASGRRVRSPLGRGHAHQWVDHPWWAEHPALRMQTCHCGASRMIERKVAAAAAGGVGDRP